MKTRLLTSFALFVAFSGLMFSQITLANAQVSIQGGGPISGPIYNPITGPIFCALGGGCQPTPTPISSPISSPITSPVIKPIPTPIIKPIPATRFIVSGQLMYKINLSFLPKYLRNIPLPAPRSNVLVYNTKTKSITWVQTNLLGQYSVALEKGTYIFSSQLQQTRYPAVYSSSSVKLDIGRNINNLNFYATIYPLVPSYR